MCVLSLNSSTRKIYTLNRGERGLHIQKIRDYYWLIKWTYLNYSI